MQGRLGGWHGAVLTVDLSSGEASRDAIDDEVLARFVGGVGLGSWLCLRAGGADVRDAFDPAAPIVFASSPLVGTALATSAKLAVVGRSPLTGLLSDGLTSSDFAIALKRCGIDALVVKGAASSISEIVIDDGEVRIESAARLAGCPAAECRRAGFETAAIGPAGEHRVRFANISNSGRHAGRGGLGAVLGAKRVKAISVRGSHVTAVFDRPAVTARARALALRSLGPETAKYRELGTLANLEVFDRLGVLPQRNFEAPREPSSKPILGDDDAGGGYTAPLALGASHERRSCAACRIGCEHRFLSQPESGESVRLEYESAWALGPLLGVADRKQVLAAAAACDALGLDTISAGGTLALAMEIGGFGIGFGDGDRVPALLVDIAFRRGDDSGRGDNGDNRDDGDKKNGDLLAEGARRVAESLGCPEAAMHVKGLELPGYDPRGLQAMALGLAVGTRGADHNRSGAYELDFSTCIDRTHLQLQDVPRVIEVEDRTAALDSLVLCKFLRGAFADPEREWTAMLHEVTGVEVDVAGLGARVCLLRRFFNQRAGWRPEDDALPERLIPGNLKDGGLDRLIARYYRLRGCDEAGFVTFETLRSHGLEGLWDENSCGKKLWAEESSGEDRDGSRAPAPVEVGR